MVRVWKIASASASMIRRCQNRASAHPRSAPARTVASPVRDKRADEFDQPVLARDRASAARRPAPARENRARAPAGRRCRPVARRSDVSAIAACGSAIARIRNSRAAVRGSAGTASIGRKPPAPSSTNTPLRRQCSGEFRNTGGFADAGLADDSDDAGRAARSACASAA